MRDGDTIGGLVVMHVPGHTAGSIALMRDDGWCSLETHY
jgi:glyoxylase-like metal-dependent hydrolase (beta-lactamase superfamily II)